MTVTTSPDAPPAEITGTRIAGVDRTDGPCTRCGLREPALIHHATANGHDFASGADAPGPAAAVQAAEVAARQTHDAGTCQDSEWSCSHCETAMTGDILCPSWCAVTPERHQAEIRDGAFVVHLSNPGVEQTLVPSASLQLVTMPDRSPVPGQGHLVYANDPGTHGEFSLAAAGNLADDLLRALEIAREVSPDGEFERYAERMAIQVCKLVAADGRGHDVLAEAAGIPLSRFLRALSGRVPFLVVDLIALAGVLGVETAQMFPDDEPCGTDSAAGVPA